MPIDATQNLALVIASCTVPGKEALVQREVSQWLASFMDSNPTVEMSESKTMIDDDSAITTLPSSADSVPIESSALNKELLLGLIAQKEVELLQLLYELRNAEATDSNSDQSDMSMIDESTIDIASSNAFDIISFDQLDRFDQFTLFSPSSFIQTAVCDGTSIPSASDPPTFFERLSEDLTALRPNQRRRGGGDNVKPSGKFLALREAQMKGIIAIHWYVF